MKKTFDNEIRAAIKKYGDERIDIAVEVDSAYAFYHSRNNSFPVTENYPLKELGGLKGLKKYEKEFDNLCVCED